MLVDKVLNRSLDLTYGDQYTFTSDATNTTSRFSILLSRVTTGVEQSLTLPATIDQTDGQIKVTIRNQAVTSGYISISNTLGQQIANVPVSGETTTIDRSLTPGVYLVSVHVGNRQTTKKLAIK